MNNSTGTTPPITCFLVSEPNPIVRCQLVVHAFSKICGKTMKEGYIVSGRHSCKCPASVIVSRLLQSELCKGCDVSSTMLPQSGEQKYRSAECDPSVIGFLKPALYEVFCLPCSFSNFPVRDCFQTRQQRSRLPAAVADATHLPCCSCKLSHIYCESPACTYSICVQRR